MTQPQGEGLEGRVLLGRVFNPSPNVMPMMGTPFSRGIPASLALLKAASLAAAFAKRDGFVGAASPTGPASAHRHMLLVVGGRGRGGGLAVLAKGGEGMGVPFFSATILWRSLMSLTTSFCCS
ncbi:MAG: hypothetical protein FRX49_12494 [Trebouxia sp. A1-2]|nr:MAG: hypothetical protein FRX49_12494 [Trebouxia sp. A1-2]